MSRENRKDPRVNLALDVTIFTAPGEQKFKTKDISFRGVFIVTKDPYNLRHLVRFHTQTESGEKFELLGLVAHRINSFDAKERNKLPGMGIQLYSLGPEARKRWRRFVTDSCEADPQTRHELEMRNMPRVKIHLKNEKMKKQFMEHDFPSSGLFYRTSALAPVGSRVLCEIVHPVTEKSFQLVATVLETRQGSRRERGLQIQFDELSEASNVRFGRFDAGEATSASEVSEVDSTPTKANKRTISQVDETVNMSHVDDTVQMPQQISEVEEVMATSDILSVADAEAAYVDGISGSSETT